jgi:hypothetical protein
MFAGLTKKNVDRSNWRYLTEKEVRALKYFGASNAKELRKVFHEFMKDLTTDEREEMRFVLHAEAIRRGLGKYSITARRHSW